MSQQQLLLGATHSSGYILDNSVYGDGSTGYFSRTPGTTVSNTKAIFGGWVKRTKLGIIAAVTDNLYSTWDGGAASDAGHFHIRFYDTSDQLRIQGGLTVFRQTTAVFRDTSGWLPWLVSVDTTDGTAGNRIRVWCGLNADGSLMEHTSFGTSNNPSASLALGFGRAQASFVGSINAVDFFPANYTHFFYLNGKSIQAGDKVVSDFFAAAPSPSPGLIPKDLTGLFGTNAHDYWLKFENGASLGDDSSGNGNNFTKTGTVTQTTDSPTDQASNDIGNFCTWNAVRPSTSALTNGNLTAAGTASSTISVSQDDKWYWEITANAAGVTAGLENTAGTTYTQGVTNATTTGFRYTHSTTTLEYTTDGTAYTTVSAAVVGTAFPFTTGASATLKNGNGALSYTVPTGFKRLCTANLPAPTIKDASSHFTAGLYTGTGATLSISGLDFQPDWVVTKRRDAAGSWAWFDAVRGATKYLSSDSTAAEVTDAASLTSFNADGFTLGTATIVNTNTATYVYYAGKFNGAGAANTDGTVSSTVSANITAGMSIVKWTGTAANATVGHGLGAVPKFIITKANTQVTEWPVYHGSLLNTEHMVLNTTADKVADAAYWNSTTATSTVFSLGASTNTNNTNGMLAYCFAEKEGFSKFGSYTGNGVADGPFIWCGFRPKYVLLRRLGAAQDWAIFDSVRSSYNVGVVGLKPNAAEAEYTANDRDFLSNGFKLRAIGGDTNASGSIYIFAAFAEFPLGGIGTTQGKAR